MLLHGGGLSWWNYRDEANLLKENYHVVLPVLDGHADSDTPFTTIENNAKELISYIDENFDGTILAICGFISRWASSRRNAFTKKQYMQIGSYRECFGCAYANDSRIDCADLWHKLRAHQEKWFSEAQFKSLKIQDKLYEDYYRDTCKIRKQDMIRFLKSNSSYVAKPSLANTTANVIIIVGGKEQKVMRRSAEILHTMIPNSKLQILNSILSW